MERGYRYHDHTADITVECWAPTLEEAFEVAAVATFNVIVDTKTVEPKEPVKITVTGIDLEELLVEWIGQLLAFIDLNNQFYSKFEVKSIVKISDNWKLVGIAWGEEIDLSKHDFHTQVKAMTYADMDINTTSEKTVLRFTLDL